MSNEKKWLVEVTYLPGNPAERPAFVPHVASRHSTKALAEKAAEKCRRMAGGRYNSIAVREVTP